MSKNGSCLWGCNTKYNGIENQCTYTAGGNVNCKNDNYSETQYSWNGIDNRGQIVNIPGVCFQNCDKSIITNNKKFEEPILSIGSDSGKYTKFIMRDLF